MIRRFLETVQEDVGSCRPLRGYRRLDATQVVRYLGTTQVIRYLGTTQGESKRRDGTEGSDLKVLVVG